MVAVQINTYGSYNVLAVNREVPRPVISDKQALVEVYAASINPFDWKLRSGYLKNNIPLKFPFTLGGDFSGRIIEIRENSSGLQIGDEIYGQANAISGASGAFAEYAAVNIRNVAKKPATTDMMEAAALPLVGISAIKAIEEHIIIRKGQKILIHGGAGGIGGIAIQMAKSAGAYVTTTVSQKDVNYVRSLGADKVIDYHKEHFESVLKDYDAAFDTVGGEVTNKSFLILKKGGVLVSMAGKPDDSLTQKYGIRTIRQNTITNTKNLTRLSELVDSGMIKIHIDKIFPIHEVRNAFRFQEEGHPRGKVVLKIK